MKPEDFKSRETGRVVKVSGGAWAFVPQSPPPPMKYDQETVLLFYRLLKCSQPTARHAVAMLEKVGLLLILARTMERSTV